MSLTVTYIYIAHMKEASPHPYVNKQESTKILASD